MNYLNWYTREEIVRMRLIDLYQLPLQATHYDILLEAERRMKDYKELYIIKARLSNKIQLLQAY